MKSSFSMILLSAVVMLASCSKDDVKPKDKLQIGSFYYSDKTHSINYDTSKKCIGVVCQINPNDANKGKIISLVEEEKSWSSEAIMTEAHSVDNGLLNTATVFVLPNAFTGDYPAFGWCNEMNILWSEVGLSWYIPSRDEVSLYNHLQKINNSLSQVPDASPISDTYYWSSTEDEDATTHAWAINQRSGSMNVYKKTDIYKVRLFLDI